MAPMRFSLSGKIFNTVLVFSVAVVLAVSAIITLMYYFTYEHEAEAQLTSRALDAAEYLNKTPSAANEPALAEQFAGQTRYTLIAPDGTVLFDSAAAEGSSENHADRPEVQEAARQGQSSTMRYSETLQTDTVYAAVKLEDGSIVRLADTRHSLLSFLTTMVVPIIAILALVVVLVFFLSRLLTRRIMKPIDALNFKEPLANKIYEEMDPLLARIDEQQVLLKQQNEEIARAETLRRDFSSNVSHEMKTPLQVISGYAELMKNDMTDPADRQRFAGLIYEEAQAMRALINDVLTLSRLDESALGHLDQRIDLLGVAKSVALRLAGFSDSACVSVQVSGESAVITGNETLAEEMLYNLVENGIRYSHEGGTVALDVRTDAPDAVVSVRDEGVGIPPDLQDKIFERFFRVDKSRSKETGGTGLGLAIVKHAVLYHGGTIEVDSVEGAHTTFTLRLPLADPDSE